MDNHLLARLFSSEEKYAARAGYAARDGGYSGNTVVGYRRDAVAIIRKNSLKFQVDALVGYWALNLFDRTFSRVENPRRFGPKMLALACFSISLRKAGVSMERKDLHKYLKDNDSTACVSDLEIMQAKVGDVLQWDLNCKILDFVKYYWEKTIDPVELQRVKNTVVDSIQHMEFSEFSPSTIAGAAVGKVKTQALGVGDPASYHFQGPHPGNNGNINQCMERMRAVCRAEYDFEEVIPNAGFDAFQFPINWAEPPQVVRRKFLDKLKFWSH